MTSTPETRFHEVFGPGSPVQPDLPSSLKEAVFVRMRNVFAGDNAGRFRKARIYFLKTFHPDPGDSVFTRAERHAVFVRIPFIFDGKDEVRP